MTNIPVDDQLAAIITRLDAIIRLLSHMLPQGIPQRQKIKLLSETGLQPREIAAILGTTANVVSKELSLMRKQKDSDTSVGGANKIEEEKESTPQVTLDAKNASPSTSKDSQTNAASEN